jgi:hypothetical protein
MTNEEEIKWLEEELGPDSAANPRHAMHGVRGLPTQVDDLVLFWNKSKWNDAMLGGEVEDDPVVPVRPPKGAQVLQWDFNEEKRAEPLPFWFNEFPSFLGTVMVIGGALFFTKGAVSVAWGYAKHVSGRAARKTVFQMRHQRDRWLVRRDMQREHGTVPLTHERNVVPQSVLNVARARSQRYLDKETQLITELRNTGRLLQMRFDRTPKEERMGLTLEQLITANSGKEEAEFDDRVPKYKRMRRWPGLQVVLRALWQLRPVPRKGLRTLRRIHRLLMRRLKKGVKFSAVLGIFMLMLLAFFTYGVERMWEYEQNPVTVAEERRFWDYLRTLRSDALGGREIGIDWGVVQLRRALATQSPEYRARLEARYGSLDTMQGPIAAAKQRLSGWYAPYEEHVNAWRAEFLRDKYVWPIVVTLPLLLWFYNRSDKYHALWGFSFVTTGAYWMIDPNLKSYFNQPVSINTMRDIKEGGARRSWADRTAEYAAHLRNRLVREEQIAKDRRSSTPPNSK